MLPKGEREGGGINQEYGFNRYTPLYIKQINNNLLYSTGKYIQYLVITYNEKESEAVHLKLAQYCKSTIVKLKEKKVKSHSKECDKIFFNLISNEELVLSINK